MPTNLDRYGYQNIMKYAPEFSANQYPARVLMASVGLCRAISERGEEQLAYGKALGTPGWEDGVCAGDWIVAEETGGEAVAAALFPRKSALRRQSTQIGAPHDQVLAANMELILIVTSANKEYRAARLERYLVAAWDSGAQPVIVLTKCDLHPDPEALALETEKIAPGAEVFAVSSVTGYGIGALRERMRNVTSALVGSSGVGKSTLVNALAGEEIMRTQEIREDDAHGRHTTTHRELIALHDLIVIDTPGMREFGLWEPENVEQVFADIASLAEGCRFRDCKHDMEPGCAVKAAVERGELEARRLRSYVRLAASRKRPKRKSG